MFCVYKLFNTINGKIYLGKTKNFRKRKSAHLKIAKGGKDRYKESFAIIHKALVKYGDAIEFILIQEFLTENEALSAEKYWIQFYKTNVLKFGNEFGYNLTDGGDGVSGYKHTEKSKVLMKEKAPRGPNHRYYGSSSWRSNKPQDGINNNFFGQKHSAESLNKMTGLKKGIILSETHRAKISASLLGKLKKFSPEIERQIYTDYLKIKSMKYLALKYECERHTISRIIKRLS